MARRTIKVGSHGITLKVDTEKPGGGSIHPGSLLDGTEGPQLKAATDGMLSLILACACAGIDVQAPAFLEAIDTTVDAIGNNVDGDVSAEDAIALIHLHDSAVAAGMKKRTNATDREIERRTRNLFVALVGRKPTKAEITQCCYY